MPGFTFIVFENCRCTYILQHCVGGGMKPPVYLPSIFQLPKRVSDRQPSFNCDVKSLLSCRNLSDDELDVPGTVRPS